MILTLTKLSETATKLTLGWTPVPGCIGYRFTAEQQAKPSHTWDPMRSQVTFAKGSAWYKVEALGVEEFDTYPDAAPPPPPPPTGSHWIGDMTTLSAFDNHESWANERVNDPYFGQNVSPMVLQADSVVGHCARVIVANKRADGSKFPSGSVSGTTINLWEPGAYNASWWQRGQTTWCRVRYLIPDGTDPKYPGKMTPVPGDGVDNSFHVLVEWHKNDPAGAPGPTSSKLETAVYGGKPCLLFHPFSSSSSTWLYETDAVQSQANGVGGSTGPISGNVIPLKFNHWYDFLWRWKLDPDPNVGEVDWYVDGVLRAACKRATMYPKSDGSVPGVSFQAGMYRSYPSYGGRATNTTDANEHVYVGPMIVGPTKASVGA